MRSGNFRDLRRNKWYALAVLMVVGLFNYMDRLSISVLQVPIKEELGLSDTQIGALTGLAFAVVYTTVSIPIARLADKISRKLVITVALVLWSLMTAACGLASGFVALMILRMGVAVGEAGCLPASHSLLSDFFPFKQRATAIAAYGLVFPIGILISFAASGWLSSAFGWRQTFMILGLLGIALAPLIMLTMEEPTRGATDETIPSHEAPATLWLALSTLWASPSFRYLVLGGALLSYPLNVALVWNPAFYSRNFEMSLAELSLYLALMSGAVGAVGLYAGGAIADKLGKKDPRWYMWIPAIAGAALTPAMIAQYLLASTIYQSFAAGIFSALLMTVFLAPMNAIAQALAGPHLRAMASASILFATGFFGTALGPFGTGLLSDLFAKYMSAEGHSLTYAILCSAIPTVLGTLLLIKGAKHLSDELAHHQTKATQAAYA